jgi:WD40 repeat protein
VRSNARVDDHAVLLRRVHHRALHGDVRGAHNAAFSPDGTLVATAHAYDAGTGEVKLWDWKTGSRVAILTARDKRLVSVRFSPDGKSLFGLGNAPTKSKSSSAIVVWNVATRHEVRTLDGHTGRILAFRGFLLEKRFTASTPGTPTNTQSCEIT